MLVGIARFAPCALLVLAAASTATAQSCLRGDANCDGAVNNFDIEPFVIGELLGASARGAPADYLLRAAADCWEMRSCWGDIDQNGAFNNFDIDPFANCIVGGSRTLTGACGLNRGVVQVLNNPDTKRAYRLYIPADFDPTSDPVVISLHGTLSNSSDEMGPHHRAGNDGAWPDCGDPTWPELAEDRVKHRPFAVICPDLYFNGESGATLCDLAKDERHIVGILAQLQTAGEIGSDTYKLTGWSSGASAALTIGMRHPELFPDIVARYTGLDSVAELTYALDVAPRCLDEASECTWVADSNYWTSVPNWAATCGDPVTSWQDAPKLRSQTILIINNDAESYAAATVAAINDLAELNPPFTRIAQEIFPSYGNSLYDCIVPLGGHEEARRVAADALASW